MLKSKDNTEKQGNYSEVTDKKTELGLVQIVCHIALVHVMIQGEVVIEF